jgi:ribosomal protein S18 acetylase RimI-like enzyme
MSWIIPTAIKNDRLHESLFGAPPQLLPVGNPARDTNRRDRWKSQRFRRSVSDMTPGASISVEVRAALRGDLDALIQLNQVVQRLHVALYPGDFTQAVDPSAVRAFFAARLTAPKSAIGIAEADHVPVGYVWFEVQARPETPFTPLRSRIYVHHIAVAPEARRRGIATALMRHVERRAASEGINEVAVDTWAANLHAQHFFGSQGFAAFNVVLRKKLASVG